MANTKLGEFQKGMLQGLRDNQVGFNCVNDGETTIVYRSVSGLNTVEFALSVASQDEKKFRPKVGEFLARMRVESGETVKMAVTDFNYMLKAVFLIFV